MENSISTHLLLRFPRRIMKSKYKIFQEKLVKKESSKQSLADFMLKLPCNNCSSVRTQSYWKLAGLENKYMSNRIGDANVPWMWTMFRADLSFELL